MSRFDTSGESFEPGASFAGVVIERELGRGGAGIVYLARDQQLDRLVALKILNRHAMGDDPAALERFRNEAIIAAKLEHPSIIPIYSSGVDRGLAFMVMRYVPGRNLSSFLNEAAPMDVQAAVRLLRPVAVALDYAAEFNVVHRDVKPANIFVDESGTQPRALLGDFGIARAYEGTRHTATGGWVGTPDYIAPEVLKDEQATSKADQYSLACVLVECISGVSPFKRSNTAATITAQVTETPDFEALENVPPRLAEALYIALEKNPDDRYGSSSELLDAIVMSASGDPNATPATIVRRRKRGKVKRRAKIAGTIVVTTLGLLLGIAQVTGFNAREWLDGGSVSNTSSAPNTASVDSTVVAAATKDQPDVLILGSSLADEWSEWKLKKGVTLPDIVVDALAQNPKTIDYRVKVVPLKSDVSCAREVKDAVDSMPSKAIVVLESPCLEQIVKIFGSKTVEAPPIYFLGTTWQAEQIAAAFVPHAPSAAYPEIDPELAVAYGDIDEERFVPLQLQTTGNSFESGVVARHYGATQCVYISSHYTTASDKIQPGLVEVGLKGTDQPGLRNVTLALTPDGDAPIDFVDEASASADCVVVPIANWDSGSDPNFIAAWKASVRNAPEKLFVVSGGSTSDSLIKWMSQQSNVVQVNGRNWLPSVPNERFTPTARDAIQDWNAAFFVDDRAVLFTVTDLIAHMSKEAPKGEIPSAEWVPENWVETDDEVTYDYAVSRLVPTRWGFASGYAAQICILKKCLWYVGGTVDSDLSSAPPLPIAQSKSK